MIDPCRRLRARREPSLEPVARREAVWLIAGCVVVVHLLALFSTPILPFPDDSFRIATAEIRAGYDDPSRPYRAWVRLEPLAGRPNVVHQWWASSGLFGPPATASRLFLAVYLVATPVLLFTIIKTLGGTAWAGLLALPFLWNFSVAYGFTEFAGAIPAALVVVLLMIRWAQTDSPWWLVALSVGLVFTYMSHAIMGVFAMLYAGAAVLLVVGPHARRLLGPGLALVPSAALFAVWQHKQSATANGFGWLRTYYYHRSQFLAGLPGRFLDLFRLDNRSLISPMGGALISAAFVAVTLCAVGFAVWRARRAGRFGASLWGRPGDEQGRPAALRACAALLLVAAGVVALAPLGFPPYYWIYQRFTGMLMMALALTAAWLLAPGWRPGRGLGFALAALPLLHAGLWFEHLWSFRPYARDILTVLSQVPDGELLGVYIADARYRGDAEAFMHVGNQFIVRRRQMAVSMIYDFDHTCLARARPKEVLPSFADAQDHGPDVYINAPLIRYVLVRGEPTPDGAAGFRRTFEPAVHLGNWTVFRRQRAQ